MSYLALSKRFFGLLAFLLAWKSISSLLIWRHNTQHNAIQHNGIQHNDILYKNTQHNDVQLLCCVSQISPLF
jgi:hypothetical protein